MKFVLSFLIAFIAITSSVIAYPARDTNDDAEVIVVPLERRNTYHDPDYDNFQGVVDTGYGNEYFPGYIPLANPYYPWNWNFRGFFNNFEDIFHNMRTHVKTQWSNIPILRFGGDDDDKGNTTSTVKIIDGHKVVINDTVYEKDTDFGKSIFKVRVIDVQPLDNNTEKPENDNEVTEIPTRIDIDEKDEKEETTTATATTEKTNETRDVENGSPEELDDNDNELPSDIDIDNTAELIDNEHIEHQNFLQKTNLYHYEDVDGVTKHNSEIESNENEGYEHNDILFDEHIAPIDLSNDIAINYILEKQGAPTNPDAEVFSVEDNKPVASSASKISYHFPKFDTIK